MDLSDGAQAKDGYGRGAQKHRLSEQCLLSAWANGGSLAHRARQRCVESLAWSSMVVLAGGTDLATNMELNGV